jgi:hypothetical protein
MQDRSARTWVTVLLAALVAALFVGVALVRNALSDDSDGDERAKNEEILRQLKPPAGAVVRLKRSEPAYESTSDISERKVGYMTDLEYDVPKSISSPRFVADAYARQLPDWKRHEEIIPCEETFAGKIPTPCRDLVIDVFRKGDAEVSLNIDGFEGPRPWGYELTIMQRDR